MYWNFKYQTFMKDFTKKLLNIFGYEIHKKNYTPNYNGPDKLTYSNAIKLLYFRNLFEKIKNVDGDIVECGVANGRTLSYLVFLSKQESRRRKIWAFDSFEGLPDPSLEDGGSVGFRGKFNYAMSIVIDFLKKVGVEEDFIQTQMRFIPGFFDTSLKLYTGPGIALIHADVDLYKSYKDILETLYSKLVPGGIIAFDEYLATDELAAYPGAHKAINEFLGDLKSEIQSDPVTGKSYLVKK